MVNTGNHCTEYVRVCQDAQRRSSRVIGKVSLQMATRVLSWGGRGGGSWGPCTGPLNPKEQANARTKKQRQEHGPADGATAL